MTSFEGKAELSINHVKTQCDGDYISIHIVDETSLAAYVNVQVPLEVFAKALVGLAGQRVSCMWKNMDLLGMKREWKEEVIIVPLSYEDRTDDECRELLKPYEIDGWKGKTRDLGNHHNWIGETFEENGVRMARVKVNFTRYVEDTRD